MLLMDEAKAADSGKLRGLRHLWRFMLCAWLALSGWCVATAADLTVSPTTVQLNVGQTAQLTVANASGRVDVNSSNTDIATARYNATTHTVAVIARGAGTATVTVTARSSRVTVRVTVTRSGSGGSLAVNPTGMTVGVNATGQVQVTGASGTLRVTSANTAIATASLSNTTITVRGLAVGSTSLTVSDGRGSVTVTIVVTGSVGGTTGRYTLVAWNDLGMHCVDGSDYSIFSILPPYNNLHAQLVDTSTGKLVTSGVTLTYQSVADVQGSINTISSTKTNFWQFVLSLFGVQPAPDVGLTGNPTPSNQPAAMSFNATQGWYEAEGLPILPYDDARTKNFYPMVRVVAKNTAGQVIATTDTVLPVSDEMTCKGCHLSVTSGNAAQLAAKPKVGWAFDPSIERDWKRNVLRLHDEKQLGTPAFTQALNAHNFDARGLAATAEAGRPILCAACHGSNALPGTGIVGISAMTSAMHTRHAPVIDPVRGIALNADTNRSACYQCHPGSDTKCLRGAMSNVVDATGNQAVNCQSCHGNMLAVGKASRVGWLEQPNCQSCHYNGKRETSALDANGILRAVTDTRFATNPNKPATGFSLFRFSKGHGGLQCEACHGATHAEYPSQEANDNVQSIALQGYAGTITECRVCHATVPNTTSGGPHGMHTIGNAWVSSHGDVAERNASACTACHGADYRGSPLSAIKVAKTFRVDGSNRSFAAGHQMNCYDCHNGPRGD